MTVLRFTEVIVEANFALETGFCLRAQASPVLLPRLRQLLFAHDESSMYGVDVVERGSKAGEVKIRNHAIEFQLPYFAAFLYLLQPRPNRLLQLQWSDSFASWHAYAWFVLERLKQGQFLPTLQGGFKIELHAEHSDLHLQLAELRAAIGAEGADRMFSEVVVELIQHHEPLRDAMAQIEQGEPFAHRSQQTLLDEEDWLIALGLREDEVPFRLAIQLHEPSSSESSWRLHAAVQARNGEGAWIALEQYATSEAEAMSDGIRWALPSDAPSEWHPYFAERMRKEEARWYTAIPEWAEQGKKCLRLHFSESEALQFLQHASEALARAGVIVLLPAWWERVRTRKIRLKAAVRPTFGAGMDVHANFGLQQIVDFDWKLAIGDIDLSEAEFMKLAQEQRQFVNVQGEWIHLHPDDVAKVQSWLQKQQKKGNKLTISDMMQMYLRGEKAFLNEDDWSQSPYAIMGEVELNERLREWIAQLQDTSQMKPLEAPRGFQGTLRPYQAVGLGWMTFLRQYGLGCVLADDMGLGKTIQFTAYIMRVLEMGQANGPSLLICPTSVIGNWEKELEKFAPTLNVYVHYGAKRLKGEAFAAELAASGAQIVLTSYTLAPLDEEEFGAIQWDVICLDEAQNIKNYYTKQSIAIRQFHAAHRIALTGTPMENRLTELWSIYDFINPGYLGSLQEFRATMITPIERDRDEARIAELQRWVKPFMLRRLKKDPSIALSLPDKQEMNLYLTLTLEQGTLYENYVAALLEKIDSLGAMQRRGFILATLTKLKQLCDHPALVAADGDWSIERSNKVQRVLEMVEEIAAEGERVLIFTQYVEMGAMLQRQISERLDGMWTPYLHGGVPKSERDRMIDRFRNPNESACAFVLSLKAGGTGLNLTAANHVIHVDRWWNPAVENQATDRAYRIGQQRNVQVHKFVTLGTLEERIDEMIARKQSLNEQVVGQSEGWITELSTADLRELFQLRMAHIEGT